MHEDSLVKICGEQTVFENNFGKIYILVTWNNFYI